MKIAQVVFVGVLAVSAAAAQAANTPEQVKLTPQTTIPIVFVGGVSADSAHAGDRVRAKTTQMVRLADGSVIRAGSEVVGSVVAATPFRFDKTPYARQQASTLTVRFDEVVAGSEHLPLKVTVRAMADPFATNAARAPLANDDTLDTVEQVGGDQLRPSQSEVLSRDGDVVAYNKRDGVYAHLVAGSGNSPVRCDASSTEVSVGIFSASACGLYGFAGATPAEVGSSSNPSTLSLVSARRAPQIWQHSTALLEVLP